MLLSGGVDSSVAVALLVEAGVRPDLWYIQIGPERDSTDYTCTIEEDLEMARAVAYKYKLPLQVVDLHKDYWEHVVDYTMNRVREGLTPNPDVMCNRLIKFGVFNERVGKDYDVIATGHYATTEDEEVQEIVNGRSALLGAKQRFTLEEGNASHLKKSSIRKLTWLCTSPDPVKDQTDFLAQLEPWQLQKACFPIGHLPKSEVRAIAEREHLLAAHRKDSQGICFLGKIDYNEYIRRFLGEKPGQVIDRTTGRVLGLHRGLWFHTIGQRKGLGFGGGPWFVVEKDVKRNILWVVNGYDPAESYSDHFRIVAPHWLTVDPFAAGLMEPNAEGWNASIKIRHTPDFSLARVVLLDDGSLDVRTERPLQGVAPGQFGVLYDVGHHRCYGSGELREKC